MAQFVFTNFLETELLDDISAGATTIHIAPSMAAKLETFALVDDKEARFVLWDGVNSPEVIGVTENPGTGYLTVVRGEEGTSSLPWASGTQVICSLTADIINSALLAYFDITAILNMNFLKLTGGTLTGALLLAADPAVPLGAATKQYVDSIQGNKLPLAGGTMLGSINMNSNRVINLPEPVTGTEAARKLELDEVVADQSDVNGDRSGVITTAGTGASYTVTTQAVIGTLIDGMTLTARFHATNEAGAVLTVNATAAKPLRVVVGQDLPEKFLQAGMPYSWIYDLSADAFYLIGAYRGLMRNRPGDFKWSAIEVDHDACLLCDGRSLLRADYPTLFTNIGTKYGAADGTHFNIPAQSGMGLIGRDLTGAGAVTTNLTTSSGVNTATVASASNLYIGQIIIGNANVTAGTKITDIVGTTITMSAVATGTGTASTRFSIFSDPAVTGATGGAKSTAIAVRNKPAYTPSGSITNGAITINGNPANFAGANNNNGGGGGVFGVTTAAMTLTASQAASTFTGVSDGGTGVPLSTQSPAIVSNLFIYAY